MKLEVGMYCYNKTNRKLGIGEIISFPIKNNVNIKYKNDIETISIENVEASHNIIDLIEVGDYVNGYKISAIYNDDSVVNEYNLKHKKCLGKNIYDEDYQEYLIYEEDIETIVTKEQFEVMSYKVGDFNE